MGGQEKMSKLAEQIRAIFKMRASNPEAKAKNYILVLIMIYMMLKKIITMSIEISKQLITICLHIVLNEVLFSATHRHSRIIYKYLAIEDSSIL
jgi:uncharacterized protein YacL